MPMKKAVADNVTDSWFCIDCKVNTAPGFVDGRTMRALFALGSPGVENRTGGDSEIYIVRRGVWLKARMQGWNGCLCIGCLEKRIGRTLTPKDFDHENPLNRLGGTPRLRSRRGY